MNKPQPNILLISTDQQRFDAAGRAAPGFLRTPHIDILESEGLTFSSAYSDCPICVPARTTIMTGRSALSHGLYRNGRTSSAMGSRETLPAHLRELGYQTLAVGKMHFGPQRVRHGFDEMILPDDYYRWIEAAGYPYKPMRNGLGQLELYPGRSTVPEALTLTAWTADRCVDFIRYRRDPSAPFFLWCSFSKPHPPLDPPEPYFSMYRDAPIAEPLESEWSRSEACPGPFQRAQWRRRIDTIDPLTLRAGRAAYYGLVTHIDYSLGRLFAALQDSGEWKNTIILYTSDHGEYLGDHGGGGKLFFHEPSAHVPFIVRPHEAWWEESSNRRGLSEVVDTPVSLADVLPTLVAAAGGTAQPEVEGQDVLSSAVLDSNERYIYGLVGFESDCDYFAATDGRWKYIYYPEGPVEQLFDLRSDPGELKNLATDTTGDAIRELGILRASLLEHLRGHGAPILADGELPTRPGVNATRTEMGRRALHSFHTENYDGDVRH